MTHNYGIVVIGRNEGERLRRCLLSVVKDEVPVVYVDSGSTDNSITLAKELGAMVHELDMSIPFTAARARNAGRNVLKQAYSGLKYIQFVDGDCEVVDGWLQSAADFLADHDDIAMVCGRLRERYPDFSIYNALCDTEWDTDPGESSSCGGNSMVRLDAFDQESGFRECLIAGEEPELCLRFKKHNWKIWRLDHEMALHDANIHRFSQWWRRSVRSGYAYAEGEYIHGQFPDFFRVGDNRSIRLWGLWIPILVLVSTLFLGWTGLLILLLYPLQFFRIYQNGHNYIKRHRFSWAFFLLFGKFPEMVGQFKFFISRFTQKQSKLIEYK